MERDSEMSSKIRLNRFVERDQVSGLISKLTFQKSNYVYLITSASREDLYESRR